MRQELRSAFVIVPLLIVLACGKREEESFLSKSVTTDPAKKVSDALLTFLQTEDFDSAVKLFAFPSTYTQKELLKDTHNITKGLTNLRGEFGAISEIKDHSGSIVSYDVGLSGGDIPFLKSCPSTKELRYEARFNNQGSGYITVSVCRPDKEWKVLQLKYGLPAYRPFAKETIAAILAKLIAKRGG